jgi:hypothetical protein
VAGDDPSILANALALSHFAEDIGSLIGLVDRALALNPSFARGWHISGILRIWADQPDIAIERRKVRPPPSCAYAWARGAGQTDEVGRAVLDRVGRRHLRGVSPKLALAG